MNKARDKGKEQKKWKKGKNKVLRKKKGKKDKC